MVNQNKIDAMKKVRDVLSTHAQDCQRKLKLNKKLLKDLADEQARLKAQVKLSQISASVFDLHLARLEA